MTVVSDLPSSAKLQTAPGSWRFHYEGESLDHWLTWYVPFSDLKVFWDKVLYTPESITISPGPPAVVISRVVSLRCPMDDRAVALSIDGGNFQPNQEKDEAGPWEEVSGVWVPNQTTPPFPLAVCTVHFSAPRYRTDGERPFMDVSEESNSERRTIPNIAYELEDDLGNFVERLSADVAIPAGTSRFRLTWHELGLSDLAAAQTTFEAIKDRVNDAVVTLPFVNVTCQPGTLHMLSKSASVQLGFGNSAKATLSAELNHFPGGWNRYVASTPPFTGQLLRARPRPIEEASFAPLFGYS